MSILAHIKHRILAFIFIGRYRFTRYFSAWGRLVVRTPEEKMSEMCMQWVSTHGIEGDYLEFGPFYSRSFICAYHFAQLYRLAHMRFYAFDSSHGLPLINPFCTGHFTSALHNFRNNLIQHGIDTNKVDIIPGWYTHMLTPILQKQLPIRKAAVVWIDCDLYESTASALDFVTPYAQDGTIFIFDDWFAFRGKPGLGQPRAFTEWLAQNPHIRAIEYYRSESATMAFILHIYPDSATATRTDTPPPQRHSDNRP